jgi:hypothetical protein
MEKYRSLFPSLNIWGIIIEYLYLTERIFLHFTNKFFSEFVESRKLAGLSRLENENNSNYIYRFSKYGRENLNLRIFNIKANQEKTLMFSNSMRSFGSLQIGSKIFIHGGRRDNQNIAETFAMEFPSFEKINHSNSTIPKILPSLGYFNQKSFFSVGGFQGILSPKPTKTCEKYLITQKKWELCPNLNEAKDSYSLCSIFNEFLYVFGKDRFGKFLNIECWNLKWKLWKLLAVKDESEFPLGTFCFHNGNEKILLFGNERKTFNYFIKTNQIEFCEETEPLPKSNCGGSFQNKQFYSIDHKGYIRAFNLETHKWHFYHQT